LPISPRLAHGVSQCAMAPVPYTTPGVMRYSNPPGRLPTTLAFVKVSEVGPISVTLQGGLTGDRASKKVLIGRVV
jgi:hypothetical protein